MSKETPLFQWHQDNAGRMVEFAGWQLPVTYGQGLIAEHLATRKHGGLFDISHMGRFRVRGRGAGSFLEKMLTNSATRLRTGLAQYTIISNTQGRALDDAYLYQWKDDEYLLVVNAANKDKDWAWLSAAKPFDVDLIDISEQMSMVAVQGPMTEGLVSKVLSGEMPTSGRNHGAWMHFNDHTVFVSRTGYTGEPVSFELFIPWDQTVTVWEKLAAVGGESGIVPVGLGARDTLRLEAALPLYGHEYTEDLPIMAIPTAKFGVRVDEQRPDFIGDQALAAQVKEIADGGVDLVPRHVVCIAALEKGMMREGSPVIVDGREVGAMTSATTVPAWAFEDNRPGEDSYTRAIGLALVERAIKVGQEVTILYRKRNLTGRVVPSFVRQVGEYLKPKRFEEEAL